MTVVPVGVDHTVFRPRPERTQIPGRIMVTSSSDVPMKGLVPLLEALGEVAHRARRRARRHRPAPRGRAGGRTIDRLGLARCRALRERDLRRRAGRHVRRGRGGGGPVVLRRFLVACHRGHGVRGPAGRDDRRCAPRGGGRRRRDRPCSSHPTTPRRWPPASSRILDDRRLGGPSRCRAAAARARALHMGGDGCGHRRAYRLLLDDPPGAAETTARMLAVEDLRRHPERGRPC